jgi:hypothetical protein
VIIHTKYNTGLNGSTARGYLSRRRGQVRLQLCAAGGFAWDPFRGNVQNAIKEAPPATHLVISPHLTSPHYLTSPHLIISPYSSPRHRPPCHARARAWAPAQLSSARRQGRKGRVFAGQVYDGKPGRRKGSKGGAQLTRPAADVRAFPLSDCIRARVPPCSPPCNNTTG